MSFNINCIYFVQNLHYSLIILLFLWSFDVVGYPAHENHMPLIPRGVFLGGGGPRRGEPADSDLSVKQLVK